jgi:hypothetical protein
MAFILLWKIDFKSFAFVTATRESRSQVAAHRETAHSLNTIFVPLDRQFGSIIVLRSSCLRKLNEPYPLH